MAPYRHFPENSFVVLCSLGTSQFDQLVGSSKKTPKTPKCVFWGGTENFDNKNQIFSSIIPIPSCKIFGLLFQKIIAFKSFPKGPKIPPHHCHTGPN